MIGGLSFASAWVLLGLAGLPLLWWLLRAVPPAPRRIRFPAAELLLGAPDVDQVVQRTPWWLLALRVLAAALVILGAAGPVLRAPAVPQAGADRLLIVLDADWVAVPHWTAHLAEVRAALRAADRQGQQVAILALTAPRAVPPEFAPAATWLPRLAGVAPAAWRPDPALPDMPGAFDTLWIASGADFPGRAALLTQLQAKGTVRFSQPSAPEPALIAPELTDQGLRATVTRAGGTPAAQLRLRAIGRDPAGLPADLAEGVVTFAAGARRGSADLTLPPLLRNRVQRLVIDGQSNAGATYLLADQLRRPQIGLISGRVAGQGALLLDPLHYLRQALAPRADLIEARLLDVVRAAPDAIILADVAQLAPPEEAALTDWVDKGGQLLRFAGPDMARLADQDLPLSPVRLRAGGRSLGGAMSWAAPKTLAPFAPDGPFAGLVPPQDVSVRAQVLADPGPDLAAKVIARLEDGTPLITRAAQGRGSVTLVHVTAHAAWSNLPLSGIFPQILARLTRATGAAPPAAADAQTVWQIQEQLSPTGAVSPVEGGARLTGATLPARPSAEAPPGLYTAAAGQRALNVDTQGLAPATWPADLPRAGDEATPKALAGLCWALALLLLAVDVVATRAMGGLGAVLGLCLIAALPPSAEAQNTDPEGRALPPSAAAELTLGYVLTGDAQVDDLSRDGLRGLGQALRRRTTVAPGPPQPVEIALDDLAFLALLYWPVTKDQPLLTPEAVARLRTYLRSGGMILFDTKDADFGAGPEAARLRALAAPLGLPALEPIPDDHVLTRSFYLLDRFDGRQSGGVPWVAAVSYQNLGDGMPFRSSTDGVSPVVIGGNDWAGAWAIDAQGGRLLPVGRGQAGEQQREMALRFGVNLVMYALTGNYKSDQVHVPALLDRLEARP